MLSKILENWLQFCIIIGVVTICIIAIAHKTDPLKHLIELIKSLAETFVKDELPLKFKAAIVNLLLAILAFLLSFLLLSPSALMKFGLNSDYTISGYEITIFSLFIVVLIISLRFISKTKESAKTNNNIDDSPDLY